MRISIVTDAWHPQVNGVVRTLSKVTDFFERRGHAVQIVTAEGRPTFGLPTYPEIRLAARHFCLRQRAVLSPSTVVETKKLV